MMANIEQGTVKQRKYIYSNIGYKDVIFINNIVMMIIKCFEDLKKDRLAIFLRQHFIRKQFAPLYKFPILNL